MLEQLRGGDEFIRANMTVDGRPMSVHLLHPLPENSLWAVSPADSIAVVVHRPASEDPRAGSFVVVKLRAPGDTVFARAYRYTPRRVGCAAFERVLFIPSGAAGDRVWALVLSEMDEPWLVLYEVTTG